MRILILNGPNLNLLGQREPEVYGTMTLDELNAAVSAHAATLAQQRDAIDLAFFQSNHEGQLIDIIHNASGNYDGIVYNPAAHTHYSLALRDAIAAVPTPVVEVHLSDISVREQFRHSSVMADVCIGQYKGKGVQSYCDALESLIAHLDEVALGMALGAATDTTIDRAVQER